MFLRAVNNLQHNNGTNALGKDSTLLLENLAGNIDVVLPRRVAPPSPLLATPSNVGQFRIFKRVDSGVTVAGTLDPIITFSTVASGSDTLSIEANTTITGSLTIGTLQLTSSGITGAVLTNTVINSPSITTPTITSPTISGNLGLGSSSAIQFNALNGPSSITSAIHGALVVGGIPGNIANNYASATLGGSELQATGSGAVVLGGNRGFATGQNSAILGGYNYSTQSNAASGLASVIIGSNDAVVQSLFSGVYSATGSKIYTGSNSDNGRYSVIIGGGGHLMAADSGYANTIAGGLNNAVEQGGSNLAFMGGGYINKVTSGGEFVALVGGKSNKIEQSHGSFLGGGTNNLIKNQIVTWTNGASAILGGNQNTIDSGIIRSVILGGTGNTMTNTWEGQSNAIIAAGDSTIDSGLYSFLTGIGNIAQGWNQVVMGHYNVPSVGWPPSGIAFMIGNGASATARSNALSLDWAGNLVISGALTSPNVNVSGTVTATKAKFTDTVRIEPRGGLSMGEFTYDPEAQ